jgi:hypothetical protein
LALLVVKTPVESYRFVNVISGWFLTVLFP